MQLVTGFGSVSLCFSSSDIEHVFAIRLRDPWRFVLRAGTLDPRSTEKEIENRYYLLLLTRIRFRRVLSSV